jgi:hypothetical protein
MKTRCFVFALAVLLCWAESPLAQGPMLQRGTKEIGVSGTLDFQQQSDVVIDLTGRYGFFLQNNLEVGGFAELAGDLDSTFRYGLGVFGEYHFPQAIAKTPSLVPYLGADLGLEFAHSDFGEDNDALVFRPRAGLKWFIRDYFAIDTSLFLALATDDLFENRRNHLENYDLGLRVGIRVHFK